MANWKKLASGAAGAAGGAGGLNVEDVFSTYLYDGTGATQTITNGIDLDGEGGMTWIKLRNSASNNELYDTERGATYSICTNTTNAAITRSTGLTSFNSNGFTVGSGTNVNANNYDIASWTFRKAPKFFDVVTWTGNGSSGRTVSHNLGSVPGCIFIKRTSSTEDWVVYHVGADATSPEDYYFKLNTTAARIDSTAAFNDTAPTSTQFTLGNNGDVNASSETYVAYLFAHNDGDGDFGPTGDQDIIKCGSYTGNGSSQDINLGFEPQWVLFKNSSYNDIYNISHWTIYDNMRGVFVAFDDNHLRPNTSDAEQTGNDELKFTATGFSPQLGTRTLNASGDNYIYIAIRRGPMAVPESATDVFTPLVGLTSSNAPPLYQATHTIDTVIDHLRLGDSAFIVDRSRGNRLIKTSDTSAEAGNASYTWDYQTGAFNRTAGSTTWYIGQCFRRAPHFFDMVNYVGTGSSSLTVNHNLGVVPEMIWVKRTSGTSNFKVYHKDLTNQNSYLYLNTTAAEVSNQTNVWPTAPSDTQITIGNYTGDFVGGGDRGVAYLFATLDGVSKVGSYTGNGSTQTIDCGFSTGARFVLIKNYSTPDSWYYWDTTRGIVAGNDPYLRLNTTGAESSSDDWIDPNNSGFALPQNNKTNENGTTYIFYAIA